MHSGKRRRWPVSSPANIGTSLALPKSWLATRGRAPAYETARTELAKSRSATRLRRCPFVSGVPQAGPADKDAAFSAAQKAIALRPASVDAVVGASFEEALARIKARFGDNDGAIADLQRLLGINYLGPEQIALTPALLRLDPAWTSLRNDPRFEELSRMKQP